MKNQNFIIIFSLVLLFGISINQALAQNVDDDSLTGAVSDAEEYTKQTGQPFDYEEVKVFLQLVLRNSEGQLLAYVETEENLAVRPWYLDTYLNTVSDKKIISKDGNRYELIQFERYEPPAVKSYYSMAMYVLIAPGDDNKNMPVLWMNHEAYQVQPGDQLKVYWTVFRPI